MVIAERELAVIDNVRQMPVYGAPYTSPHLVIALNHSGWVRAEYDLHEVMFSPHELCVLFPNHMLIPHEASEDYRATLIVATASMFERLRQRQPFRHYMSYMRHPAFKLDDDAFSTVRDMFTMIRTVSRLETSSRTLMLDNLLSVFSQLCDVFRFEGSEPEEPVMDGKRLFPRFYDAIVAHHASTREVAFYADIFHLTPKYFSTIIKRETGVAAGDWISNYVIIQAKSLLRNRSDLNIQQVAAAVGFDDQAAFSRYFKTNTGISPKSYRARWSK